MGRWPDDFASLEQGVGYAMCDDGRPDDNGFGLRILWNALPHLHTHIVPRHETDADAGAPPVFDIEGPRNEERVKFDADTLRMRLATEASDVGS
jgi:diadenosine tetraphosphate (Ap4A) HIT family hydrolase